MELAICALLAFILLCLRRLLTGAKFDTADFGVWMITISFVLSCGPIILVIIALPAWAVSGFGLVAYAYLNGLDEKQMIAEYKWWVFLPLYVPCLVAVAWFVIRSELEDRKNAGKGIQPSPPGSRRDD